ncbi:hypothetical protein SAMN05216382_0639 [Sphingomonas palmae]|uniref:Uncharacterized protein n=1 Tax=Sphingomonas palmae TaxID=1855283 RepID=A0A1H7HZ96_9SPHN|nr:hypothetical protein [Sphingomonas palmae]SEK55611.1 hypothetical protein SAMN05216382_0639 [Sphingomonas palmae]
MQRPASIITFERLYLSGFALSLVSWVVDWPAMQAKLAANPQTKPFGWMLFVMLGLNIAITLLLWFFTARRASVVAKWIVVVLAGLSALRFLFNLPAALGGAMGAPSLILSVLTTALGVAAAAMLFRFDARAWFGEDVTDELVEDGE